MYEPKTEPFDHQRTVLEDTWHREIFAVFWEQGTGKTKLAIDTAARLYDDGRIDAVLVVAPNGVHTNWIVDELPTHLPDRYEAGTYEFVTRSKATKWHATMVREARRRAGLTWFCISYSAFMTKEGKRAVWEFLRDRRCLYILDESMFVKNMSAKRTRSILASAKYATYKRIMTGTPVGNGPFDVYSQVHFLDSGFWLRHGLNGYQAFKHYFAKMQPRSVVVNTKKGPREKTVYFPIHWENLDQLRDWLDPIRSRVLKDDVLDLPPKVFTKRYFDMTPAQRSLYEKIKEEFIAELDSGVLITAPLVLTRMLRLQQITCGYIPTDEPNAPLHRIDAKSTTPRLGLVEDWSDAMTQQGLVWAEWNEDIDQMMEMLGDRAVRYDGGVDEAQRERNKRAFKAGDKQFFVSKPSVAGTGHTLTEAKSTLYYNNSFNLIRRMQSEDRNHRAGQDGGDHNRVDYTDIVARDTQDEKVVHALRNKFNIAGEINGDEVRDWI